MTVQTCDQLQAKKCVPCERGVAKFTRQQAREQLRELPGWTLNEDATRIRREWVARNFASAMNFFNQVAELAETEGHHPDLHLEGYRHVTIELWTHAIGGLSENDFIVAAKIDQLPIELKGQPRV